MIGLGLMGGALARTFLHNGYEVTAWNRSPDKTQALEQEGAIAASSAADAIAANDTIVVCIRSNSDTRELLEAAGGLEGKNVIDLSTGSAPEAEALYQSVTERGARCLIGMICTFPRDIGKQDSTLVMVGDEGLWNETADMLKTLGGKSTYVGTQIGALAILYSALLLPRQGFMFGMLYGAHLCNRAGFPLESYVEQMPLTIKVVHDYYDVFAASAPGRNYDDPQASIDVYAAAFEDTMKSFREHGATDDFPRLMAQWLDAGAAAGLGDKQITALIDLLDEKSLQ
jgi:3-hydroxyisobutyrate dehydrogenase-like beta-hydroxyacid dehydrogenase